VIRLFIRCLVAKAVRKLAEDGQFRCCAHTNSRARRPSSMATAAKHVAALSLSVSKPDELNGTRQHGRTAIFSVAVRSARQGVGGPLHSHSALALPFFDFDLGGGFRIWVVIAASSPPSAEQLLQHSMAAGTKQTP